MSPDNREIQSSGSLPDGYCSSNLGAVEKHRTRKGRSSVVPRENFTVLFHSRDVDRRLSIHGSFCALNRKLKIRRRRETFPDTPESSLPGNRVRGNTINKGPKLRMLSNNEAIFAIG